VQHALPDYLGCSLEGLLLSFLWCLACFFALCGLAADSCCVAVASGAGFAGVAGVAGVAGSAGFAGAAGLAEAAGFLCCVWAATHMALLITRASAATMRRFMGRT
jgi:hypothetical protein